MKTRVLFVAVALVALCVARSGAQSWTTLCTETFTDTQYTDLPSHTPTGSPGCTAWVNDVGTNRIGTSGTFLGSAGESRSHITNTVAADQAAQMAIFDATVGFVNAVGVRYAFVDGTFWGFTGYIAYWFDSDTVRLAKVDGSTVTELCTAAITFSNPDTLRVEAYGTTITAKVNGSTACSQTDATYSSGTAMLFTGGTADDWADNFAVEESSAPPPASCTGRLSLLGAGAC